MSINNQAEPSPHFTSSHLHHLNNIHNNYYTSLNNHHHHIPQPQPCKAVANNNSSINTNINNGTNGISQYILESNPAAAPTYGSYVINSQPESTDCSKLTVKTESSMLKNESDMMNKKTNNSPLTSPCSKMTTTVDDNNKSTCFSYLTSVTHSPPTSSSATDCSKLDTTMSSMYDAGSGMNVNGSCGGGGQDSKSDPIIEYNPELAESIEYELGLKKQNGPR